MLAMMIAVAALAIRRPVSRQVNSKEMPMNTNGAGGSAAKTRDYAAEMKRALDVLVGVMNDAAEAGERYSFKITLIDGKNSLTNLSVERALL